MSQVDEYELFAEFIGRNLSLDKLDELESKKTNGEDSYSDCNEYAVDVGRVISKSPDERLLFMLYLYLDENVLKGGRVIKRVVISPKSSVESDLNPSELIVVENILRYITEEEKEDEQK